jgi:hypothetical protein
LQQPRAALVVRRWNPADAKIHRSSTLTEAAYAKELIIPFGPFFVKFCSHFPYNAKLCINGNEYLKRQLAKRGVAFEALDNGVKSCANQLSADDRLLRKWLRRLPHPFPARDRAAGYRYQLSILQPEFSVTQVLDQTVTGRIFFEKVIRENLDIGRPSQVSRVFDRKVNRRTPGQFRTRVITDGVVPSLHVDYKKTRRRFAPKLPSTIPATSPSADTSKISRNCLRSTLRPTDVCSTSNALVTTASSAKPPSKTCKDLSR